LDEDMDGAKTIRASDRRDGFLFLGNQLALDFLNTRPVQNGEAMELLRDFSALLRWFQAAELLSARDAAHLEEKWRKSVRAWHGGYAGIAGEIEEGGSGVGAWRHRTSLNC
jgi:putative stress-induced transcription regulator